MAKDKDIESTREHTRILSQSDIAKERAHDSRMNRKSGGMSPLVGTLRAVMITLIGLALAVIILLITFFSLKHNYFDPVDRNDGTPVRVEIPSGSSLSTIADILYEHGIIRNTGVFKVYVDFNDMSSKMKAGTYDLSRDMTLDDVIGILGTGTSNISVTTFTATEGMTITDIAEMFVETGILDDSQDFLDICESGVGVDALTFDVFTADGQATTDEAREQYTTGVKYLLEGYLFPDTYEIFINSAPETIINKMLNRFQDIYSADYLARTQELGMTINDVVTLASIIEREGKPQDFKKISAVFHNRIKQDDKLQSCATVQYVIGVKKYQFTSEELAVVSPYNTYVVAGLPIAPISNPGKQAIEAALYPDEEYLSQGYYFFCSKDPESGELAFAKTYEEHQANVALYESLWEAYDSKLE